MSESPIHVPPRAFISYSWTNPAHEAWVLDLAIRLTKDGIDIILDKWELRPGHDSYAFMESMVTDPSVTKVIMICDQAYVQKANARAGGVGTEGQIISPELYGKVAQDKYAALVTEVDERGHRHVPIFYKGRIYFDFVSVDRFEVEYEELLRWLADKPRSVKPAIGRLPEKILAPVVALGIDAPAKVEIAVKAKLPEPKKREPDVAIGRDAAEFALKEAKLARDQGKADRAFRIALAGWVMAQENGASVPSELAECLGDWCLFESGRFKIKTASNNDKITTFSPDGKYILISVYNKHALQLIDAKNGVPIGGPMLHSAAISCAQFSPDGELIASGSAKGEVSLWNVATQSLHGNVMKHGGSAIQFIMFSFNRRRFLTCDSTYIIQWQPDDSKKLVKDIFVGSFNHISNCEYSVDSRMILISGDKHIRIYESVSGEIKHADVAHHCGENFAHARFLFSRDQLIFANNFIYKYDILNNCTMDLSNVSIRGHFISDIFRNDVALILNDIKLVVYDFSKGNIFYDVQFGTSITSAKFSNDGQYIVISIRNCIYLLCAETGASLRSPLLIKNTVVSASFSPDGETIMIISDNGDVSLWDISSTYLEGDALVEHICRHHLIDDQQFTDAELRASMIPDLPRNPVAACLAWLERKRSASA